MEEAQTHRTWACLIYVIVTAVSNGHDDNDDNDGQNRQNRSCL